MILWDLYFSEYTLGNADGNPYLINKDTESQKGERVCLGPKGILGGLGGRGWCMAASPASAPRIRSH